MCAKQVGGVQPRRKRQDTAQQQARLKPSDLRALLVESARLGVPDADKADDLVKQLARKYGVDEHILQKVLRYNSLPRRNESPGMSLEQMGFREEESS